MGYDQNNVSVSINAGKHYWASSYKDMGFQDFDLNKYDFQLSAFRAELFDRLRKQFDRPGESYMDIQLDISSLPTSVYDDSHKPLDGIRIISEKYREDKEPDLKAW